MKFIKVILNFTNNRRRKIIVCNCHKIRNLHWPSSSVSNSCKICILFHDSKKVQWQPFCHCGMEKEWIYSPINDCSMKVNGTKSTFVICNMNNTNSEPYETWPLQKHGFKSFKQIFSNVQPTYVAIKQS